MTIRFAAARTGEGAVLARALMRPVWRDAVNDNGSRLGRDALLRATLKHFAQHGLAAASWAKENAEQAFFAGDRPQYEYWLDICRALDRRMAGAVAHRRGKHR